MSDNTRDDDYVPPWTLLPAGSRIRVVDERHDPPVVELDYSELVAFRVFYDFSETRTYVLTCRGTQLLLGMQCSNQDGTGAVVYELQLPS